MSDKRAARARESRLESTLRRLTAREERIRTDLRLAEQKALTELAAAGYSFRDIGEAKQYRQQRASLHRLIAEDLILGSTHIEKRRAS